MPMRMKNPSSYPCAKKSLTKISMSWSGSISEILWKADVNILIEFTELRNSADTLSSLTGCRSTNFKSLWRQVGTIAASVACLRGKLMLNNARNPIPRVSSDGVGGSLVHLMDFKFIGGPEKSTVGSIPIYSHQGAGAKCTSTAYPLSRRTRLIINSWAAKSAGACRRRAVVINC